MIAMISTKIGLVKYSVVVFIYVEERITTTLFNTLYVPVDIMNLIFTFIKFSTSHGLDTD